MEINYRAAEVKVHRGSAPPKLSSNPISQLEFAKNNFDFNDLQKNNKEYIFPKDVIFKEPPAPIDFKEELLQKNIRENKKEVKFRSISLFELMNKRTLEEVSAKNRKICYLIVSHGMFVDGQSQIYDFYKNNQQIAKTPFSEIS